jgi:hypothetical protein
MTVEMKTCRERVPHLYSGLTLGFICVAVSVAGIICSTNYKQNVTVLAGSGELCVGGSFVLPFKNATSLLGEEVSENSSVLALHNEAAGRGNTHEHSLSVVVIVSSILLPFVPVLAKYPSSWAQNKIHTTLVHFVGQISSASMTEVIRSLVEMPDMTFLNKCRLSPQECLNQLSTFGSLQLFSLIPPRQSSPNHTLPSSTSDTLPVFCPNTDFNLHELNESLHGMPDMTSAMVGAGLAMFLINMISWLLSRYAVATKLQTLSDRPQYTSVPLLPITRRAKQGQTITSASRYTSGEEEEEDPDAIRCAPEEDHCAATTVPAATSTTNASNYFLPRYAANTIIVVSLVGFVMLFTYYQYSQTTHTLAVVGSSVMFGFIMQVIISTVYYANKLSV